MAMGLMFSFSDRLMDALDIFSDFSDPKTGLNEKKVCTSPSLDGIKLKEPMALAETMLPSLTSSPEKVSTPLFLSGSD